MQLSLSDDDYYQCQVMATEESPSIVSLVAYVNVLGKLNLGKCFVPITVVGKLRKLDS